MWGRRLAGALAPCYLLAKWGSGKQLPGADRNSSKVFSLPASISLHGADLGNGNSQEPLTPFFPQLGDLQRAYEGAKKTAHQLKRKCHHLTWDLEDTRVLLENQQSRNHELEKRQKK